MTQTTTVRYRLSQFRSEVNPDTPNQLGFCKGVWKLGVQGRFFDYMENMYNVHCTMYNEHCTYKADSSSLHWPVPRLLTH